MQLEATVKKKRRKIQKEQRCRAGLHLPKRKVKGSRAHESGAHLSPTQKEVGQGLLKHAIGQSFNSMFCKEIACKISLHWTRAVSLEITAKAGRATWNYCEDCWNEKVCLDSIREFIANQHGETPDMEYILSTGAIVTIPGSWFVVRNPTNEQTEFKLLTAKGERC